MKRLSESKVAVFGLGGVGVAAERLDLGLVPPDWPQPRSNSAVARTSQTLGHRRALFAFGFEQKSKGASIGAHDAQAPSQPNRNDRVMTLRLVGVQVAENVLKSVGPFDAPLYPRNGLKRTLIP